MKLNWGVGIFAGYGVFLIIVLGTVLFTTTEDINLVTEDYYEQEIAYQQQIDKMNRTKDLPEQLEIKVEQGRIRFAFPKMFESGEISGSLHIYRPSSNKMDLRVPIALNSNNEQIFPTSGIAKGLWEINVDWQANGNEYFNKKKVLIN